MSNYDFEAKNLDTLKKMLSDQSYFLSLDFIKNRYGERFFDEQITTDSTNKLLTVLIDFCVSKSNVIATNEITLSFENVKNSHEVLRVLLFPIIEDVNVKFISIFGTREFLEIAKGFFLFYKKFNDIKIEVYDNVENHIMLYDNKPLCLIIKEINTYEEFGAPFQRTKKYAISFSYEREIHSAIRLNFTNNPQKVERRLKIEELNKK
jgi:hypothetical protein